MTLLLGTGIGFMTSILYPREQRLSSILVAAKGRSKEAGVQKTPEASWIPAPDQGEGRLCAGMTRTMASQGGLRPKIPLPENLYHPFPPRNIVFH
jgi:hypothetical protein